MQRNADYWAFFTKPSILLSNISAAHILSHLFLPAVIFSSAALTVIPLVMPRAFAGVVRSATGAARAASKVLGAKFFEDDGCHPALFHCLYVETAAQGKTMRAFNDKRQGLVVCPHDFQPCGSTIVKRDLRYFIKARYTDCLVSSCVTETRQLQGYRKSHEKANKDLYFTDFMSHPHILKIKKHGIVFNSIPVPPDALPPFPLLAFGRASTSGNRETGRAENGCCKYAR